MTARTLLFVGTLTRATPYYEGARGRGLAVLRFDEATGDLTPLAETAGIDNPTFLTVDPERSCLYASSEVHGWDEGTVAAYRIDPETGALGYLGKQPTLGSITCYHRLDASRRWLILANYATAPTAGPDCSVAVLQVREDGALGPPVAGLRLGGTGPNPLRQERTHGHSVVLSPDNRLVLLADLGTDLVRVLRFDPATGALEEATVPPLRVPPGAGPRHLAVHPSGRLVFVMNELDSTICAMRWHADGRLELIGTQTALPGAEGVASAGADLHLSPDGRFLYGSNRGHDSLVVLEVDGETGGLAPVALHPTGGRTPRSFALDPSGRFLLVGNQDSDAIAVFRRDAGTGRLEDTGRRVSIGTPMCLRFARFAA